MISVCIAAYNGSEYISRQLSSILAQLNEDDEIIISDDNSSDSTVEKILRIGDKRIKLLRNEVGNRDYKYAIGHYRSAKNFENAIKNASGEYIFLSDQDDIWCTDKVNIMISYLKDYSLVMSNYAVVDAHEHLLMEKNYYRNPVRNSLIMNVLKMPFHGCCMAFTKEIKELVLPFPSNLIMHDNWIGCVAFMRKKKICFIDVPLIKYRRHSSNVSTTVGKSKNPLFFKVLYRLKFFFDLCMFSFSRQS